MAAHSHGQSGRGGRGGKGVDGRADGGGKSADSRADKRTGPTRRGHTDGQKRRGRGPARTDGRMGGRADGRIGQSGPPLRGRADRRMGGRAGGPGFKRPHSTRLGSLLGAQSACLVRARVRRVPRSVVGSSTIPRQIPVLSARTHLPRLSASVLGAEKGILLFRYKNGFTQGRWQRNAKSTTSNSCTKGRGWRRGQEKAKSGGLGARRVPQPRAACVPGMGAAAAAMVSSDGHEVCRIPPL